MYYRDLNLRQIRDDCDLDFAHFTYQRGMCSCCYGPKDLPKRYWKNGKIPEGDGYEFILFKNADNGSGCVTKNNKIEDQTYIEWSLSDEKLQKVCQMLQEQLGEKYKVIVPEDEYSCIIIRDYEKFKEEEKIKKIKNDFGYKYYGCIEIKNGIYFSDPCYDENVWCIHKSVDIKPGTYWCFVKHASNEETGGWGQRVGEIAIFNADENIVVPDKIIANVGVDSGMCGFYDADYYLSTRNKELWYEDICYLVPPGDGHVHDGKCFISSTGYGDGMYSVIAGYNGDEMTSAIIRYLTEEDFED